MPTPNARPYGIVVDGRGQPWFTEFGSNRLGTVWRTPGGAEAHPYGMAVDDRDRLWLIETGLQPNRLVGFDPLRGKFFSSTAIPSGGRSVRHMFFHKPTDSLWFGTDTNTLARARMD